MILALFFTRGVSLQKWVETGLFEREKLIYEELLNCGYLKKVYWCTYGRHDAELAKELHVENHLNSGIQVIPVPRLFNGKLGELIYSFLMPFLQRVSFKQADIYKTNQMDGSWSAVFAKLLYRKPLIVRTGYALSLLAKRMKEPTVRILIYQLMERVAYKYADYAIVTSKNSEKYILDMYRYLKKRKNVMFIPNYVDTKTFKPKTIKKFISRVVFVGRLSEEKNLFNLINAMAKTGFTLDIYGKGELRDILEKYAIKKKAHVNFRGTVPNSELPDILNRYKYYILPSYFEGMPKTLLEAMACGLHCIGTDVGGINEVIENGVCGALASGTDVQSLVRVLQKVVGHNSSTICTNAVEKIKRSFSLRSVAEREGELLLKTVSR
jgi:glycosyltransferase involved in cell wall biosynthesis